MTDKSEPEWGRGPAVVYDEGLAAGQLRYQRCVSCGRSVFYPRLVCPYCSSTQLEWHVSIGRGVIYSATWINRRAGGYSVVLVDLEEGFRMMSTVIDAAGEDIKIGEPVHLRFDNSESSPRPVFTLGRP